MSEKVFFKLKDSLGIFNSWLFFTVYEQKRGIMMNTFRTPLYVESENMMEDEIKLRELQSWYMSPASDSEGAE